MGRALQRIQRRYEAIRASLEEESRRRNRLQKKTLASAADLESNGKVTPRSHARWRARVAARDHSTIIIFKSIEAYNKRAEEAKAYAATLPDSMVDPAGQANQHQSTSGESAPQITVSIDDSCRLDGPWNEEDSSKALPLPATPTEKAFGFLDDDPSFTVLFQHDAVSVGRGEADVHAVPSLSTSREDSACQLGVEKHTAAGYAEVCRLHAVTPNGTDEPHNTNGSVRPEPTVVDNVLPQQVDDNTFLPVVSAITELKSDVFNAMRTLLSGPQSPKTQGGDTEPDSSHLAPAVDSRSTVHKAQEGDSSPRPNVDEAQQLVAVPDQPVNLPPPSPLAQVSPTKTVISASSSASVSSELASAIRRKVLAWRSGIVASAEWTVFPSRQLRSTDRWHCKDVSVGESASVIAGRDDVVSRRVTDLRVVNVS